MKIKPEKKFKLERDRTHDPCDTGACAVLQLTELSSPSGSWSLCLGRLTRKSRFLNHCVKSGRSLHSRCTKGRERGPGRGGSRTQSAQRAWTFGKVVARKRLSIMRGDGTGRFDCRSHGNFHITSTLTFHILDCPSYYISSILVC